MNNTIKHITAVVGLPIVLACAATLSSAGNWVADYSLDADIAYDDNFFMADEEQDTWVYSVKPEVSLIYVSPVAKSQLDARLAFKRYSDFDQFDSEDPAFDWKNSYKTQRSNWSFNTGYSENSQRDAAEQDVGSAAGHVGCDGHRTGHTSLRDDHRLLLMVAGIQHFVLYTFVFNRRREG